MAGPFYNPAAGISLTSAGASAVESPVAPVTISAADGVTAGLNLASQGVAMYGQYQRSQGRSGGTRSGRPDPNVAVFAEEMNKVQQIRSEKGDLAGRLAERSVASNFAAAGVSFKDKAYKSVYESTTGRSFNIYGRDDDEYFRQKALESPEVQAAFLASKAILPPGTSTESALEWSRNEAAEQGAAAFALNKAQSDATVAWQVGGEKDSGSSKAFRKVRSSFMAGTLGALLQRYESGQVLTPKDIADAKVEWTSLKARALRRPPSLSGAAGDSQWKAFEDGNESINNFFTTLESASSSKTLLDTQISILADAVDKSDSMTTLEKTVATAGLLQGKSEVYDSLVAGKLGDLFEKLSNVKIPPISSPEVINRDPVKGISYQISEEEAAKYQGMAGMDISNQIIATAGHAKVFDPNSIGNAQNREAFGKTMTGMIAALQSSNQEDFFSPAYLRKHVLNPTILATLEAYKKSDPDQADLLRGGLQLGYQMEKTRQQQSLSSIEAREKIARYTRFNEETNSYELNINEFSGGFADTVIAFNDALRDHYNNNLSDAARDGFDKIINTGGSISLNRGRVENILKGKNPRDIVVLAKLDELTHAVKRRDAISALDKGISDLSLNQESGQTMDQAPPPPPAIVQPAGATSGVSDTLMDTLALIESINNPDAVSSAGARGLYQLMPETAAKPGFKVKPLSTGSDIDAAPAEEQRRFSKDYLSAMLKEYDGDLALALAAYNGGPGRVDDYIKDGKALPTESVQYVQKFVDQGQVPQENSVSSGKVVEPSSGPGLDSQGRPLLRPKVGAKVDESGMLSGLISSVRSALNLGSDEEAQSVAEKLMQSGVIPSRPDMRLPPVRGPEQNNLPPSNPTLAAAQLRQQSRDKASIDLNSESLAQLDPSTAESLVNLGSPIVGLALRQLPWANVQSFGQYLSKGKIDIKDVPFNDNDKALIKEKVTEALAAGKNKLDYPDWGVTGKGVLVGGLLGTAQKSVSDPNFRMATFLGQVGIRKAPNGDIILVDKYDFNPGPKGDKLKEALLARETGDAATYEKLKEEALGGLSWLEATRVWAATLKISDTPAEEFTINLGKLKE